MKYALLTLLFTGSVVAQVTNIESDGNLQSQLAVECVSIDKLTSKNTPADIFIGFSKCLQTKNYMKASRLYLVAMAYGKFDTLRVMDKSAHQAIAVLRMNSTMELDEQEIQDLQKALQSETEDMTEICASLKLLGLPEYHPTYMIQHGMGAFTGNKSKDGLIKGFNPTSSWEEVITKFVKCSS